ncbi:MAG: GNAT family N-acetyltransferase [Bacteroidetes bacterium]|nr:GNAT family N-acetyltransferase [Bacteroidota bacterium]
MSTYLFATPRLGFRRWQATDMDAFTAINSDPEVMRFFQRPLPKEDTQAMMERMERLYDKKGFCYFAVDHLIEKKLIGTIGLGWKTFDADFTPTVDIGYRIGKSWWNQGLSTEGAAACLAYARQLQIPKVVSMASVGNLASIQVMKKIGMQYWKEFDHPELQDSPSIQRCSLYQICL